MAEVLNHFLARVERIKPRASSPTPPTHSAGTFQVQEHEVGRLLRSVNRRKATGPDGVSGEVLKTDQLAGVFMEIFNMSRSRASVPSCLRTSTIPIPQKTAAESPDDCRPGVMRCFKRLVCQHVRTSIPPHLGPPPVWLQGKPIHRRRCHSSASHCATSGCFFQLSVQSHHSRDPSPETVPPGSLHHYRLVDPGFPNEPITLNTGSPQGCVLSPLLFTLYTSDRSPTHRSKTTI